MDSFSLKGLLSHKQSTPAVRDVRHLDSVPKERGNVDRQQSQMWEGASLARAALAHCPVWEGKTIKTWLSLISPLTWLQTGLSQFKRGVFRLYENMRLRKHQRLLVGGLGQQEVTSTLHGNRCGDTVYLQHGGVCFFLLMNVELGEDLPLCAWGMIYCGKFKGKQVSG